MIHKFLNTSPRNKLVLCANMLPEFNYVDLGYELSLIISNAEKYTPIAAYDALMEIIEANEYSSSDYGKYVGLSNVGILFEPQLEFNIRHILDNLSRNYLLIIHTEGEVDDSSTFFLTKRKGVKIDLSGMSFLKLEK